MLDISSSLHDAIKGIASEVIKNAKSNLSKEGMSDGSLAKSLDYKIKETERGLDMMFLMEEHGVYVDKGVKGKGGSKADGTPYKLKRVKDTPFSYKDKMANVKAIRSWIDKKGITPRGKNGKFATKKSLSFAIARSVQHTGIETTNFFTNAVDKALKDSEKFLTEGIEGFIVDSVIDATLGNKNIIVKKI
tara:strand:- start:3247 stop:3816 length:570 start_codon:yes stop_codon:yes gene_type:complete